MNHRCTIVCTLILFYGGGGEPERDWELPEDYDINAGFYHHAGDSSSRNDANKRWDYHDHGPNQWPLMFPACGKKRQSPVALDTCNVIIKPSYCLGFNFTFYGYDATYNASLTNTGHTVRLGYDSIPHETKPHVVVTSNEGTATYHMDGLHFHWPSEHIINGIRYPLEMHMFHRRGDEDVRPGTRFLILSFVFKVCHKGESKLEVVADALQRLATPGSAKSVPPLAPAHLMAPASLQPCGYFAYPGSFTAPPCTQGVTWLVHRQPVCAEVAKVEAFHVLKDLNHRQMTGNFRPLQPLDGRAVVFAACDL